MTGAAIRTVGKAAAERVMGIGPGPVRAFIAAAATGTATAVVTYRVLRSDAMFGNDD
jgi:hypothetical protein